VLVDVEVETDVGLGVPVRDIVGVAEKVIEAVFVDVNVAVDI
jgi:hypothetical protein